MFKVMPLTAECIPPKKEYDGDAGFDVYNNEASIVIAPGDRVCLNLGFALELEIGCVALIQEKSGMALKKGLFTIGNVIDCNYRGPCHAILVNFGKEPVAILKGQKIAQMLIIPCYTGKTYDIVSNLEESNRDTEGLGSTGL